MSSMSPDVALKFINLMRDYLRQQADIRALVSILNDALANDGILPDCHWTVALEALQQTPEYQSIVQQYEPIFCAAEQKADVAEIAEILMKMPSAKVAN